MAEEQEQEQPVLFYARALYSYQVVEEGEFDFNESDVVSVIEDYGDGWWKAYTETSIGKVPANYFEVLPDTNDDQQQTEQQQDTNQNNVDEGGYSYEYSSGGYDYNGGGGDDQQQTQTQNQSLQSPSNQSDSPSLSSPTPASPPQPSHPPISESPAYAEQMKCWGDILESQKQEKNKLEKQVAESEVQLVALRRSAFYYQQLDFMLQEVLKLQTEMDLDLDASVVFQRAQLAITRDIKSIKETADSAKLETQFKRHLDDKLEEFNTKINNSMQLLENCDKTRKTFYGDLYSLQHFLEEVEARKRAEEDERRRKEEEDAEWD